MRNIGSQFSATMVALSLMAFTAQAADGTLPTPAGMTAGPSTGTNNHANASKAQGEIKEPQSKFVRGWLARIMPIGEDASVLPSDELGRFVATKDAYRFGDFVTETSIRTGVDVGWKGEGFLDVGQVGRHTFSINFTQKPKNNWFDTRNACWGAVTVEGQVVVQSRVDLYVSGRTEPDIASVVGGADLEPGRYRVEFWAACGVGKDKLVTAATENEHIRSSLNIEFEMLVKRPTEAVPTPASKALILKVQNSALSQKSP